MLTLKPYRSEHIPLGFCVHTVCSFNLTYDSTKTYGGKDAMDQLTEHLEQETTKLSNILQKEMIPLMPQECWRHNSATKSFIYCKKLDTGTAHNSMEPNPIPKVKDHDHYTRKCRGPAHRKCNLAYRIYPNIPVLAYNMNGYDSHVMIKELVKRFSEGNMSIIAENGERYIAFSIHLLMGTYVNHKGKVKDRKVELRFLYSYRFKANSLDNLSSNLVRVNDLKCETCGSDAELDYVDENYITHEKCKPIIYWQCGVRRSHHIAGNSSKSCRSQCGMKFEQPHEGHCECELSKL